MTLDVREQWELIRHLRRDVPSANTPEYREWLACWRRLCSTELVVALQSFLASRFLGSTSHDRDDAIQEALLILYKKGVWHYEFEKAGATGLLGYLCTVARNKMLETQKGAEKFPALEVLIEQAVDQWDTEGRSDAVDFLSSLSSLLTDEERIVLDGKLKNMTLKEIGHNLRIASTSKIDHIWQRIRRKAAQIMGDNSI